MMNVKNMTGGGISCSSIPSEKIKLTTGESCSEIETAQTCSLILGIDISYCIDASYYKGVSADQFLTKKRRQLVFVKTHI